METTVSGLTRPAITANFPLSRKLIEWKLEYTPNLQGSSVFPLSRKLIEWKQQSSKNPRVHSPDNFPLSRKLIEWKR